MAFEQKGGYGQPDQPENSTPPSQRTVAERERCKRCDKPVAQQADYDDPDHPGGCECDFCRALCWGDNCVEFDWRGECLRLRVELKVAEDRAQASYQDRYDALSVQTREGLLASEWVLRTGKAERERDELQASADLHSRMMERARALWQAAYPQDGDRWPDGAHNVAWLVEEIERLRTRLRDREGS